MAKARFFLFKGLSRAGNTLFRFLTRCEERGFFPKTSRWVKTTVLAGFVTAIGALSAASMLGCPIHCYAPATLNLVINASLSPNPTQGAATVILEASADIENPGEMIISRADAIIEGDTIQTIPADGSFDSSKEEFSANLYVGNLEPCSTKVQIDVYNDQDEFESITLDLEITEE